MTIPMLVLSSVLLLATGVILLVATRLVRALRHTVELESRIARLQEGLNLLTDTTETGFRQVATEVERLSSVGAPMVTVAPPPATVTRPTAARLRAATRRGRSVKDIAAAEQVSEGEVRLRLSLADASASGRTRKTTEPGRAALRA
jgi:Tfp pilus assembly protein PilW